MTPEEVSRARTKLRFAGDHLRMFMHSGSFEEATAFVAGFDLGQGADLLGGFRLWLVQRQPDNDYHCLAFSGLVVVEVTQDPRLSLVADPEVNAKSVTHLFDRLDEYLGELEAAEGIQGEDG